MNVRKHLGLIIGLGIAVVLLIVAVVLLLKFSGMFSEVDRELQKNLQQLTSLNQSKPYPSQDNIEQSAENLDLLQSYFTQLMTDLSAKQIEPKNMESAQFPPLLEKLERQLTTAAGQANVLLPDRFAFGFNRYVEGYLPRQEDIPRLVVQLAETVRFCRILFAAKIDEVKNITRTEFEKKVGDSVSIRDTEDNPYPGMEDESFSRRRRGRGRSAPSSPSAASAAPVASGHSSENDLYSAERYEMEFTGRESAFWQVMDAMAASHMFIVVKNVELVGKTPPKDLTPIKKNEAALGQSPSLAHRGASGLAKGDSLLDAPILTHEDRVVAGRDPITAKITFDIYRFKKTDVQESKP